LRILIGIAEATALADRGCSLSFTSGDGGAPAGVDMLSVKMNSSRFMLSEASWFSSDDFRSCAIPLGALAFCFCKLSRTH